MESLSTPLLAQAGGEAAAGIGNFAILALLMVVFYFLLIRPQQKRAKQQRKLVSSLEVDDRVVTIGGLHGTIRMVEEDVVHLDVAQGLLLTFAKQAIARRVVEADAGDLGDTVEGE
jgi:preprotein translocase subunit YajC